MRVTRWAAEFQPEQVWLFGSHAWVQPLRARGMTNDERQQMTNGRAELERFRNVPASLEEVMSRGRLIYG
jgi:hypothetical protein